RCAYERAAGFDIPCVRNADSLPGTPSVISSGICIEPPDGYFIQLHLRSSSAKRGLILQAGIIDSDYRGIIQFVIFNSSPSVFSIRKGNYIVQGILNKHYPISPIISDNLSTTLRQNQGFGSS
ncbi:deoxyuridine 5'-triphosphate nucleotidohydrolase, partial [Dimargaris cristalligena]